MSEFYIPGVDRQPLSDPAAWSYDPEKPSPLQHTKDQLDKLFTTNDFPFKPTDYTPGEMGYLACFGDRLIRSLKDAESKITEDDPEREQKQKGVLDLTTVTTNRVRVIHLSLQALIPNLEAIHYYRSRHTGQPFIDAASRVFLFLDPAALAKAASLNDPEFDLASASPQVLSRALYLNGCEQLVVNDGHLAYSASLTNLLPAVADTSAAPTAAATGSPAPAAAGSTTVSSSPTGAEATTSPMITEHNRAIRFFCLAFLQVLKSAQEGDKQKTLTMLESQISARLLQTTLFFKAKPADSSPTGSDAPSANAAGSDSANSSTTAGNTEFLVLSDGQGHTALGAYTDRSSIPQDGGFYPEMPVYNIAYQLIQDDNQVGGIILNPGELNFFLDKNWLTRLVRFAQKIAEAKQQKDANQADSKQSKPSQADASQAEPLHSDASQAEPEQK